MDLFRSASVAKADRRISNSWPPMRFCCIGRSLNDVPHDRSRFRSTSPQGNKTRTESVQVIVRQHGLLLLFSVLLLRSTPVSAQGAVQLFHEMQIALGGAQKI